MRASSCLIAAALLAASSASAPALAADASNELLGAPSAPANPSTPTRGRAPRPDAAADGTYTEGEVAEQVEEWLGVSAETAADIVEKIFQDLGRPNGFIKGGEGAGAVGVGLRYGEGELHLATGATRHVYWQGPSIGFDTGGNASRVFTLVYGLPKADAIYDRFPGVEGSAYYIGGIGVNYLHRDSVTLAPMRAGVGLRLGANVGYLSYTKERRILPF